MRYVVVILAAVATLLSVASAEADGYTARQTEVIAAICAACERYAADCTAPLAVARRETNFGVTIYSQVDTYAGRSMSVGVFQWYAGPRGDCVGGGAACSGPHYQTHGLAWRENLYLDVDRAVQLMSQGQWSHWYTPRGLDTRNLPRCDEMSDAGRRGETVVGSQGEGLQTGDGLRRHPREQDR